MKYPIIQYTGNEGGSTSTWKGLNRTDSCYHGEFSDEINLDTSRYPVLSAAREEAEGDVGIANAKVMACLSDTDNGFCGVVLNEEATWRTLLSAEYIENNDINVKYRTSEYYGRPILFSYDYDGVNDLNVGFEVESGIENFVFYYGGEIKNISFLNANCYEDARFNALWQCDRADDLSETAQADFYANLHRVRWTVKRLGKRIIINGYDSVTERGRYYVYDIEEDKLVRSSEQIVAIKTDMGFREDSEGDYNLIRSDSKEILDFSAYIYEGDYLTISAIFSSDMHEDAIACDVYPYTSGPVFNTTSVREVKVAYKETDSATVTSSSIRFIATRKSGRFIYLPELTTGGSEWVETKGSDVVHLMLGTHVPPMDEIEVYSGRVWGISSKDNTVFASVYDTPFKMINTDESLDISGSVEFPLDGVGLLTGIASAGSELLAFNSDTLYRISGTGSSSYAILGRYNHCGCIDSRSVAEFGGVVFYLGRHGFMAYEGSQPVLISQKLNKKYSEAVGLTDGIKYYVSALPEGESEWEYLVYDPRYSIWHKRALAPFKAGYISDGKLNVLRDYDISDETADLLGVGEVQEAAVRDWCVESSVVDGGALMSWYCESGILVESTLDFKGINELWIRAVIPEGDSIEVYTAINDEELTLRQTLTGKGRMFIYKIPVRFGAGDYWRYKLKGTSGAAVFQMERKYNTEGRRHYAY